MQLWVHCPADGSPAHPAVLWGIGQRGEDAGVDRSVRLRAGGDHPQGTGSVREPPQDSPGFERERLRESAYESTTYEYLRP